MKDEWGVAVRRMVDWQHHPPRDASLMPFWFWNDAIDAESIRRSIADFDAHGVYGFVIHPRVGLPRSIGWMSDAMLDLMQVAIDEAARRDMRVILYDEGMYPSGSSSGQVVARDPSLAARCLAIQPATAPPVAGSNILQTVPLERGTYHIVDRPADAYIRGLHYRADGGEDEPPAGDILNPRTAELVIELVYQHLFDRFASHVGRTIIGIFTDEPHPLAKLRETGVFPYTTGVLPELKRLTGEDFSTKLPDLFESFGRNICERYAAAIRQRVQETWYAPLHAWCEGHGLWLMGHPDRGDEIGVQRFFHVPGQDLVWRFVEPGRPSAVEGPESTQAKCTASAKHHSARLRNSNEFCGAYGHETSFDEVRWLARWCVVRGVDLLIPHAFYHSIRGPRRDERPPQLGPHTAGWSDGTFARYAAECQRLCALNMLGTPVCEIGILTHGDQCPWPAAKVCLEHQRDFHYVPSSELMIARFVDGRFVFGHASYRALIVDGEVPASVEEALLPLGCDAPVIRFNGNETSLLTDLDRFVPWDVNLDSPTRDLRVRHVRVDGREDVYLFFNEGNEPLSGRLKIAAKGAAIWIDPATGAETPIERSDDPNAIMLSLAPWELTVLKIG